MPNWKEILAEINNTPGTPETPNPIDIVRRKYLKSIYEANGNRNVIAYYSGWLQKPQQQGTEVNDKDISGFMLCINKLDKNQGLDLILHTPGGDLAATESLVTYLKKIFGTNIRAIVPQLSMSAGTMIALSCCEIVMGKHSSLGPIDPQIGGMPCEAVILEFETARADILANPANAYLWEQILSKYYPTFLNSCRNAIDMANQMAKQWLKQNMCIDNHKKADKICKHFSSHHKSKTHSRHMSIDTCKKLGLNIVDLEDNQELQEAVLSTHHVFMHAFANAPVLKIIENHNSNAYMEIVPFQQPK
jgi:hypothetical protein